MSSEESKKGKIQKDEKKEIFKVTKPNEKYLNLPSPN